MDRLRVGVGIVAVGRYLSYLISCLVLIKLLGSIKFESRHVIYLGTARYSPSTLMGTEVLFLGFPLVSIRKPFRTCGSS